MASAAFSTGFRTDPDPIGARVSAVAGAGAGAPPRGKTYHNMHLPQVSAPRIPRRMCVCSSFVWRCPAHALCVGLAGRGDGARCVGQLEPDHGERALPVHVGQAGRAMGQHDADHVHVEAQAGRLLAGLQQVSRRKAGVILFTQKKRKQKKRGCC